VCIGQGAAGINDDARNQGLRILKARIETLDLGLL
jgi:hypothetical protein